MGVTMYLLIIAFCSPLKYFHALLARSARPCKRAVDKAVLVFLNRGIEAVLKVIISVVDVVVEAGHIVNTP